MREEEPNWFSKWDEELPSPEELTPLSQTLITPDLALAFDIPPNPNPNPNSPTTTTTTPHHHPPPPPPIPQSSDFDSPELTSGAGAGTPSGGADEPARTLKRPRLVWTPQLHKRFVDAVAHLGIKNAVPKTIMQLMSVDGLTRENVASHLQKYRLYLKRMQGLSAGGAGAGGGVGGGGAGVDAATDHLFASAPVPHHFLHPGRPASDHFLPFGPVAAALQHHHHQQQMAVAAVAAAAQQQQYQQQRQVGQFGSPPGGQFEHPFLSRQQAQPVHHRMAAATAPVAGHQPAAAYVEDLESATGGGGGGGGGGGRKVLTLFPTGDD